MRTGSCVHGQRGEGGLLVAAAAVEQAQPGRRLEAADEVGLQLEGGEGVSARAVRTARRALPGVVDALRESEGGNGNLEAVRRAVGMRAERHAAPGAAGGHAAVGQAGAAAGAGGGDGASRAVSGMPSLDRSNSLAAPALTSSAWQCFSSRYSSVRLKAAGSWHSSGCSCAKYGRICCSDGK